jgi:two-component system KDP operon response regulator KdpE
VATPKAAQRSPSPSPSADDQASILLVEDDPAVAEIVATALRGRGHTVAIALTGRAALEQSSLLEPDVVFLDLGLPDLDGTDVCRELRRWFRNPIIVISADGDEERKIAALDEGADDYVTKPFAMGELLARLRVALRHRDAVRETMDPAVMSIGDLEIDSGAHVVTAGGTRLDLSPKEFAVLAMLARNCGRVLTHAALLSRVWGASDAAKSESLRVHVAQLRKKLGEGDQRPRLLSEPGVGYRMVAPDR